MTKNNSADFYIVSIETDLRNDNSRVRSEKTRACQAIIKSHGLKTYYEFRKKKEAEAKVAELNKILDAHPECPNYRFKANEAFSLGAFGL